MTASQWQRDQSRSHPHERVISAFPATGKSYYSSRHGSEVIDSDSSKFSWKWISFDERVRDPEWPGNYIERIKADLALDRTVLVSTHAEVRQALQAAGIPFTLVIPGYGLRVEYLVRMAKRGSPLPLIETVDKHWHTWLDDCDAQECEQITTLGPGMYLSDVLAQPMAFVEEREP